MSIADDLEKLASLRDNGVLNEDEFKAKKAKIFAKIKTTKSEKVEEQKEEKHEILEKYNVNKKHGDFSANHISNKHGLLGILKLLAKIIGVIFVLAMLILNVNESHEENIINKIIQKELRSPSSR